MSMHIVRDETVTPSVLLPYSSSLWVPVPTEKPGKKTRTLKACIVMPEAGYDVTEVAQPWQRFIKHGMFVYFVAPHGRVPQADQQQLSGWRSWIVGVDAETREIYGRMSTTDEFLKPFDLFDPHFTFTDYDLVYIPGGTDPCVYELMEMSRLTELLAQYIPLTSRVSGYHVLAATAQGALAVVKAAGNLDLKTTTTPLYLERTSYLSGLTKPEAYLSAMIPSEKYVAGPMAKEWVYEDEKYFYISARHSGDIGLLCKEIFRAQHRIHG
ncbi:hypothetical protein SJAG_03450 [Schizosaccharomyces japonicus yFS275]|uniref:DJ-1/PfpI family protein n=1 Tax=Schizosaccharomyces japonicus (strain yFS275 / FY16936) TaxID=402676 RepID=B6K497_SCHJY|nr:hypothetical protein SJAG_03450 [Schizosaccharomyces japonicus yFS275]EEB08304.1 hypothetical protein SJAG_03450 [Schizosaccharomyces japonicus yFS275]